MHDRLQSHRQQLPALANKAYFNYGGQGPLPQTALAAIQQAYEYIQTAGPFSGATNTWIVKEANRTREAIASELGVLPATITLTENVSVGCNIALWGIDWKAGDHLLLTDCEHPSVVATVQELQRRFGIEVSSCQLLPTLNQGDPVATITQALQPNTRLIALSHVLWNTGQVLPLAEIANACRQQSRGTESIRILVDAAQSVGLLPLNLDEIGIDFYAFTGHKWLCGPEGLGGLYVRPDALESLHPTFIGWRSSETNSQGQLTGWKPDGRRFEVATSAYPLFAGLRSAIAFHQQWGSPAERYQQIQRLSQSLWEQLSQLPDVKCLRTSPPEAGLVSFQLSGSSHAQLVQFLETQGLQIRTIRNPDCVRACVHYFTSPEEIAQLIQGIEKFQALQ